MLYAHQGGKSELHVVLNETCSWQNVLKKFDVFRWY